ncbi:hypothetical protein L7F22_068780 [Adiantum nelumboides]|nr:hypothetical protein [Adiantum nelumboides]
MEEVWEKLGAEGASDVQALLVGLYSQPCRKYHNLHHIDDCLRELNEFKVRTSLLSDADLDEITIAIWFHDSIYDPKAHHNEEESACLFERLAEGMDPGARERIRSIILATKDHRSSCNSLQEHVLLDLDLTILGKPQKEFNEYDMAIRMEYEWVPESVFCDKRAAMLRLFLERDRIFKTDYFHTKYDSSCRSNLERAIAGLGSVSLNRIEP